MKKALISAVSFATLATTAMAADLPSRKAAPVYAPPPPMWTGFYAGLNAGYNFGTNSNAASQNWGTNWLTPTGDAVLPGTAPISMDAFSSNTQSGFIGGGQIGYNYQYGSNILLGVEADIQGTGIRGTARGGGAAAGVGPAFQGEPTGASSLAVGQTGIQGGVDWLGTVRGRVGYLWTPTLLVYGTGGFAYGGVYANVVQSSYENASFFTGEYAQTNTWVGGGRQNQLLTGWTAGGGAEWMFMPNWSLKAEALYWDLGRMNVQTATFGVSGNAESIGLANSLGWGRSSVSYQGVQAKVGVNYHFNWGIAPVVASY
jgi:outer membrane immunogenic protein